MEQINLSTETDIRKEKISILKQKGVVVFKEKFDRTHSIKQARELALDAKIKIAGRIIFRRIMGKFGFIIIRDIEEKIQVSVGINELGEENYDFYKKMVDIADFVGIEGELYKTQTGELTIRCQKLTLLSKALRPLPEKFHGLVDTEAKYRQRYLDLIANEETRQVFLGRSKLIDYTREFLKKNGFLEVETPILQRAVSGAAAKPFYTKHNALNKVYNLRIAFETYLKQMLTAGVDRVFEIGKDFRNEGMDTQHLQEFTMCEWYASYWDLEENIRFFKEFIQGLLMELKGSLQIQYQDELLDFSDNGFTRLDFVQEMNKILGFEFLDFDNQSKLVTEIVKRKILPSSEFESVKTIGGVIDLVYKRKIREKIVQPTIIFNYPASFTPFARRTDKDPRVIGKFQVIAYGMELCNAYSELIDPIIQRNALEEQARAKKAGDEEACDLDEDFILAMEHGMPPNSGLGFGVDRLMAIIFNQPSIRDVVLFPLMK